MMALSSFDTPTGRVRAVYGKTKGLVARRRALKAKAAQVKTFIEAGSSSESEAEEPIEIDDDDEKENGSLAIQQVQIPNVIKTSKDAREDVQANAKARAALIVLDGSDTEEEIVVQYRRRRTNIVHTDTEGDSYDDLVLCMDRNLKINSTDNKGDVPQKGESSDRDLLKACSQKEAQNISEFLNELQSKTRRDTWKRLGDASYSEAYALLGTRSVLKIIPLLGAAGCGRSENIVPERSAPSHVLREIQMTRALSAVSDNFVRMRSSHLVKGKYAARLLNARDRRPSPSSSDEAGPSPESFSADQRYAALVLDNAGQDLESVEDLTWTHAASIFCQVVEALSKGEQAHQFEHRDLHWGNVVVTLSSRISLGDSFSQGVPVSHLRDPNETGVKATIIDYTLSRAKVDGTLIAYDFDDETLFQGAGDMQFDIYRQMRAETKNDWGGYFPFTNVLWLNYLASKLIDEKHIPNPKRRSGLDQKSSQELHSRNFLMQAKQDLLCKRYESASDFHDHLTIMTF